MRSKSALLICSCAAAAGFLGAPIAPRPAAIVRAPSHARCAPVRATEEPNQSEPEEHWDAHDDSMLAEQIALRASSARCGRPQQVLGSLESAIVLIFNPGSQDEGVYTLQGRASRAAAYVLAFEYTDDADRFAQLLNAEGFDMATPLVWDSQQLTAFCDAGEFEVSLVPQGALITPPAKNEYDVDAFDRLSGSEEAEIADAFAAQRASFERLLNGGDGEPVM